MNRRYLELLEGIELATKAITSGDPDAPDAADWLRYRARLYRRLHAECPKSQLAGTAAAAAEADDTRAAAVELRSASTREVTS